MPNKADYSDFDVRGPLYPEPSYTKGKPFASLKVTKEIKHPVLGCRREFFDHSISMRLYNLDSAESLLADAKKAFRHGGYATCSYAWKQGLQ